MTPFELKSALDGMVCLVDSHEQDTPRLRARLRQIGNQHERCHLDFGDYSAKFPLANGEWFSLKDKVSIERKMDLTEIAGCFASKGHLSQKQLAEKDMEKCLCSRCRFTREFERAKAKNAKMYILIEDTLENLYSGNYRSQMASAALRASIWAWAARYNCTILPCSQRISGAVIRDILYREGKEQLEQIGGDNDG